LFLLSLTSPSKITEKGNIEEMEVNGAYATVIDSSKIHGRNKDNMPW
jgi:hypothetical protein